MHTHTHMRTYTHTRHARTHVSTHTQMYMYIQYDVQRIVFPLVDTLKMYKAPFSLHPPSPSHTQSFIYSQMKQSHAKVFVNTHCARRTSIRCISFSIVEKTLLLSARLTLGSHLMCRTDTCFCLYLTA